MANELLAVIGQDLTGKLVHVAEQHGSDISFVLASLAGRASSVCVLALHSGRTHHHSVAKKLGFNMDSAVFLEPFAMYVEKSGRFGDLDMGNEVNLKRLFVDLKTALSGMSSSNKCVLIDDLNDLLSLGASVSQVAAFLQYCRTLLDSSTTLVVGTHHSEDNVAQTRVNNLVSHLADCRLAVAPLRTGFSSDVTGTVHVDSRMFHYKLTDRQIRVFAPGAVH